MIYLSKVVVVNRKNGVKNLRIYDADEFTFEEVVKIEIREEQLSKLLDDKNNDIEDGTL